MEELLIAICDDSPDEVAKLTNMLEKSNIKNRYFIFNSGEDLLKNCTAEIDLFLIDIYMTGITGIEAATIIRNRMPDVPIAFITVSTDHALESYRIGALKYIEKPFKSNDIEEILELAALKKKHVPSLLIQKNKQDLHIPFSAILYLEQNNHVVYIVKANQERVKVYDKLSNLIHQCPDQLFIQVHKSYIVNLNYVKFINQDLRCFTMANNQNIPIRREDISRAKKALEDFYFRKAREL